MALGRRAGNSSYFLSGRFCAHCYISFALSACSLPSYDACLSRRRPRVRVPSLPPFSSDLAQQMETAWIVNPSNCIDLPALASGVGEAAMILATASRRSTRPGGQLSPMSK